MLFDAICKTGRLQVDETEIRVVSLFKKVLWSVPRTSLTSITHQQGRTASDFTIHTTQGTYLAQTVAKPAAEKFLALFPGLDTATQARGNEWYHDPARLTYIATYTDEKAMQKEMEAAAHYGWMAQGSTATAGHINVGRTAAKVATLGALSLVTGASRSKDKITITYVRTPEWTAQNK